MFELPGSLIIIVIFSTELNNVITLAGVIQVYHTALFTRNLTSIPHPYNANNVEPLGLHLRNAFFWKFDSPSPIALRNA